MAHGPARSGRTGRRVLGLSLVGMSALTVLVVVNAVASGSREAGPARDAGPIICPNPLDAIPAAPGAQLEINREQANLDRQLTEANERLASAAGQSTDYINGAVLEPLAGERADTLERIEIAIGRVAARPEGLERFAACELRQPATTPRTPPPTSTTTTTSAVTTTPAVPTMTATATITAAPPPTTTSPPPAVRRIVCPDPVPAIAPVPFPARPEVNSELVNLDRQLADANAQLARSAGQGPDFIRNAILEPLARKRAATLERIEIAIDRVARRPEGLERFAPCAVR